MSTYENYKNLIRAVPDFPKEGIIFRDVTNLFKDPVAFKFVIDTMVDNWSGTQIDHVAGIDARGFIIGGALAYRMNAGFIAIRKSGKLPSATLKQSYDLEYGSAELEIQSDALHSGQTVMLIDDLIATGGTADAALKLISTAGGVTVGCSFLVDLPELKGSINLSKQGAKVFSLFSF